MPIPRLLQGWRFPAALFSVLFLIVGIGIASFPGIQNDEALFAAPLYPPFSSAWTKGHVPVMLLDYLGCLKTWIYSGIFQFLEPSVWSLRLPVIASGGLTIFLFTNFISRVAGTRASWLGVCLLASDPVFALTNNFDWGPVALQHFLLISSLLAILNFHASKRAIWLAVASFGFGLALWDKAIFSWILIPIIFSTTANFWKTIFETRMPSGLLTSMPRSNFGELTRGSTESPRNTASRES